MCGPTRRQAMLEQQNHRCFYCERKMVVSPLDQPLQATVEHLVKQEHGGSNQHHNLVMACRECNSNRGDYDPETWRRVCRRVITIRKMRKSTMRKFNRMIRKNGKRLNVPHNKICLVQNKFEKVSGRVAGTIINISVGAAA